MKRFFNIFLGALAMLAVALLSAFIAMRLAIHGREVVVPNLAGLSITDASKEAAHLGLSLTLENKFYSPAIPAGHILAQSPAPGSKVRRSWAVRVTGSLGPQSVTIPNLVGLSERAATINLRQQSLDLGAVAHIPSPGESGLVVAQSPPPNATGVESPRVSLLISDPLPTPNAPPPLEPMPIQSAATPAPQPTAVAKTVQPAATTATTDKPATAPQPVTTGFPMPSLAGLTLSAAYAKAAATGLHVVSIQQASAKTRRRSHTSRHTSSQSRSSPNPYRRKDRSQGCRGPPNPPIVRCRYIYCGCHLPSRPNPQNRHPERSVSRTLRDAQSKDPERL